MVTDEKTATEENVMIEQEDEADPITQEKTSSQETIPLFENTPKSASIPHSKPIKELNWIQKLVLKKQLKKLKKEMKKADSQLQNSEDKQKRDITMALLEMQKEGDITITETICACQTADCKKTGKEHLRTEVDTNEDYLMRKTVEELQELLTQVLEYAKQKL